MHNDHDSLKRLADALDALTRSNEAVRREIANLSRRFDEFAGAYLNAKFPYGQGSDRWARRRGAR